MVQLLGIHLLLSLGKQTYFSKELLRLSFSKAKIAYISFLSLLVAVRSETTGEKRKYTREVNLQELYIKYPLEINAQLIGKG